MEIKGATVVVLAEQDPRDLTEPVAMGETAQGVEVLAAEEPMGDLMALPIPGPRAVPVEITDLEVAAVL
jgi:hypothetical protein